MNVTISQSQFTDRIMAFDSCALSYASVGALYGYIEELIGEGIIEDLVCIGTWAIYTCEYTLDELYREHFETLDEHCLDDPWVDLDDSEKLDAVTEAVSYNALDTCYSDVIHVAGDVVVMVGL